MPTNRTECSGKRKQRGEGEDPPSINSTLPPRTAEAIIYRTHKIEAQQLEQIAAAAAETCSRSSGRSYSRSRILLLQ